VILDTNALTAFADGEPGALAEIAEARLIAIPVVVLGEYLFGISQSRRRNEYEQWMKRYVHDYHIIDVNSETAARYADVRLELKRAGTPIPPNDTWIAALCRQHSLPLLRSPLRSGYGN
jgi:tRNA(fMet)-specific endonuclease VapC